MLDRWLLSISAHGGIPVGEFREHENGGGGVDLTIGVEPWQRQPLVLRGGVAYLVYGGINGEAFQDVCDVNGCRTESVSYRARNHSMTLLQGGPEITLSAGKWRPFGFALAGVTFFNSTARLVATSPSAPDPGSERLFSSHNFSTSYGLGLRRVRPAISGREIGFEFFSRLSRNAKASYLTERGVSRASDGSWLVSPRRGAANVLGFHVGIWIGPYVNWSYR
jgi:hypothetical protein